MKNSLRLYREPRATEVDIIEGNFEHIEFRYFIPNRFFMIAQECDFELKEALKRYQKMREDEEWD